MSLHPHASPGMYPALGSRPSGEADGASMLLLLLQWAIWLLLVLASNAAVLSALASGPASRELLRNIALTFLEMSGRAGDNSSCTGTFKLVTPA